MSNHLQQTIHKKNNKLNKKTKIKAKHWVEITHDMNQHSAINWNFVKKIMDISTNCKTHRNCRAQQITGSLPGTNLTPNHQEAGMIPWWKTCKKLTWEYFFLIMKNNYKKMIKTWKYIERLTQWLWELWHCVNPKVSQLPQKYKNKLIKTAIYINDLSTDLHSV